MIWPDDLQLEISVFSPALISRLVLMVVFLPLFLVLSLFCTGMAFFESRLVPFFPFVHTIRTLMVGLFCTLGSSAIRKRETRWARGYAQCRQRSEMVKRDE